MNAEIEKERSLRSASGEQGETCEHSFIGTWEHLLNIHVPYSNRNGFNARRSTSSLCRHHPRLAASQV